MVAVGARAALRGTLAAPSVGATEGVALSAASAALGGPALLPKRTHRRSPQRPQEEGGRLIMSLVHLTSRIFCLLW